MPERVVPHPEECVRQLRNWRLYRRREVPVSIGNETDMFHVRNFDYLLALLAECARAKVSNPIVLITKAALKRVNLNAVREMGLPIVFFLSYSGLGRKYEPDFTDEQLRENFSIVKACGFPVIHFWRPLLPSNTTPAAVRKMLSFVSEIADATVFVGLKLQPELSKILTRGGTIRVPRRLMGKYGEWLETDTVRRIYNEARSICPEYPLYRHSSCALAFVLKRPNHTATFYRQDICPPSQCPGGQRCICEASKRMPSEAEISEAVGMLGGDIKFERRGDRVVISRIVDQEEFSFLLHLLNCPIELKQVRMTNLYLGDTLQGQKIQFVS